MANILELKLEELHRDKDQPRKVFDNEALKELKAGIAYCGQQVPVIVRRDGERYVIVDGERRWRVLRELASETSNDAATVRALLEEDNEQASSRKARQLILNATSQDLTPAEKADTISTLQTEGADSSKNFGLTQGNLRLLRRLAGASDYVREFGVPRTYSIVHPDGSGCSEKRDCRALPLTHLIELITFDNSLRSWDAARSKIDKAHKSVAKREVKMLGERAQKEEWSRPKLKKACEKIFAALEGEKRTRAIGTAAVIKSLKTIEERLQKILTSEDAVDEDTTELEATLQALLKMIAGKRTQESATQPAA